MSSKQLLIAVTASLITACAFAAGPYAPFGEWPLNNNGIGNLGVETADSLIRPSNVNSLTPLFQITLPNDGVDSTPAIADGNAYFASGGGVVEAVDSKGNVLWKQTLSAYGHLEQFDETPVLTKNKLFIAQDNMFALDRSNGNVLWSVPIYDLVGSPGCTNFDPKRIEGAQLALAGDKVIYTFGFSDEAGTETTNYPCDHGEIVAVNQDTGNIDWRIDLTNVNGTQYGTGNGGFGQAAVDPSRHTIYMGTSNAYTAPSGPYADALLFINYDTGQVLASYQFYPNDIWSQVNGNPTAGVNDLDVRGHPQLFTLTNQNGVSVDYVAVTGKDATVRIFTRDLTSQNPQPVVQVQFGPATTSDGGIPINPAIANGMMYLTPAFGFIDANNLSLAQSVFNAPNATIGQEASFDLLLLTYGQLGATFFSHTHLIAVDLAKLIKYGKQNPTSQPVCYGTFLPPLCSGQLPTDQKIVQYDVDLGVMFPLNSSGIAYDNGVLYIPNLLGNLLMVDASSGNTLRSINVAPANPPIFGFLPNNFITGGVSVCNGGIYVSYGLSYIGNIVGNGGIVGYGLPNKNNVVCQPTTQDGNSQN